MQESWTVRRAALLSVCCLFLAACPASQSEEELATNNSAATNGVTLSGVLPVVVALPPNPPDPVSVRPNFDDFSWQSFVALNWPVDPAQRGAPLNPANPATLTSAGNSYASVWGSYREAFELYTGPVRPVPFDGPDGTPPVCGANAAGRRTLIMSSKVGTVLEDGDEAFSFPLVDQNNNYIFYEVRFNRDQYDFVRGADNNPSSWLYRAVNLMAAEQQGPISMPAGAPNPYVQGAVMVKAAWRQLTPAEDASRYFTLPSVIYDTTVTPAACRQVTMGLIGLHIGHKLAAFPQWVWSSFEQIDNVPLDNGQPPWPGHAMTLNNGTNNPQTQGGWANRPTSQQMTAQRSPTQVTRLNPIPTTPAGQSTVDINNTWRAALAGTPWANYQLVITQWPTNPSQFRIKEAGGTYPVWAGSPFPVNNAVNTTMETYFQSGRDASGAGGNSCMQCHYGAGQSDFSWSLTLRAD
ncbi:MAG TPA: hypothetical protein VJS40_02900 [Aestuariivirgaceae bacterium]|nr:hypothetical protein [Aestuariivirgaceae bacterium]